MDRCHRWNAHGCEVGVGGVFLRWVFMVQMPAGLVKSGGMSTEGSCHLKKVDGQSESNRGTWHIVVNGDMVQMTGFVGAIPCRW